MHGTSGIPSWAGGASVRGPTKASGIAWMWENIGLHTIYTMLLGS